MSSISCFARFFRSAFLLSFILSLAGMQLDGHAILKSSSPKFGGSVTRSDVPVQLTFNVRVDCAPWTGEFSRPS